MSRSAQKSYLHNPVLHGTEVGMGVYLQNKNIFFKFNEMSIPT